MIQTFTVRLNDVGIADVPFVGGKNASLGEMISQLSRKGVAVPQGFVTTSTAYWRFLDYNNLRPVLQSLMSSLDKAEFTNLSKVGAAARREIQRGAFPAEIVSAITVGYRELCDAQECEVAVRSSATAEDLPNASFAGQHESFLNIRGVAPLIRAVQNCFASLYTDRAIKYREDNGFAHEKIALSVGIQKMVRSDKGCSGVGFTIEPESGFRNIIHLSGVWGLGENIVQGAVTPDEFYVFKSALRIGKNPIIQKKLGAKEKMMIYGDNSENEVTVTNISTSAEKRETFVLNDSEIIQLAQWALMIEEHYQTPMDIEWAKDGITGQLFIIQARPETVHAREKPNLIKAYKLLEKGTILTRGSAVGEKIGQGIARILNSPADADKLNRGEVVVTDITSPDWDPILKKAAAIITNKGGRTSHASIVAREVGIPAVVGCGNATAQIRDGEMVTVSCAEGSTGFVYKGTLKYSQEELDIKKIKKPVLTDVMMILGDPDKAFQLSILPNDGIGLMRMEFLIANIIRIHPLALIRFDSLKDETIKSQIAELTRHYNRKEDYFIDKLSQGIATIAAAFHPKDVIVRMSDFKTNEYANLIGGKDFEPKEENPMLGFRGASRYYSNLYQEGFRLECESIKIVRNQMGLTNVKVMIPFCRTLSEGKKVIEVMRQFGLDRSADPSLEIYVMAEIPSNVMLADKFAEIFDGFSIGSNDLTQLTLGIDRDSAMEASLFSELDEASKEMIRIVIRKARKRGKKIGLCGQAPSDFPAFAQFLVEQGINSISFNPDAILKGIENINMAESLLTSKAPGNPPQLADETQLLS